MIAAIHLTNFKCFSQLDLEARPLTLLCGLNGMGKSSVIQTLLVLRQSFLSGELLDGRLVLGGDLADLGTGSDILHENAYEDVIAFGLESADGIRPWNLAFDYARSADELAAQPRRHHRPPSHVPMPWRSRPPFGGSFAYVNAERIGPRKMHVLSETRSRSSDLGARGEYALNYLMSHAADRFQDGDARARAKTSARLSDEVDYWLQEVTPGAHLQLGPVDKA